MSRVAVAMSGGVDSSVACLLLKRQGWEVTGFTFQLLPKDLEEEDNFRSCCSVAATELARQVCAQLGVPHYSLNYREEFKQLVLSPTCEAYLNGRTPNPCILCNQQIKFLHFLRKAEELNMDAIATGHYARIVRSPVNNRWQLRRGYDSKKEQSYFLHMMTQEQLSRVLMPLGELKKKEVRKLASAAGLPTAEVPESQDLCFVPESDLQAFLRKQLSSRVAPGKLLGPNGEELGEHEGVCFYTIGQRKGLGLSSSARLYVRSLDAERAVVKVGRESELYSKWLRAEQVNWIEPPAESPIHCTVKIRYNAPDVPARVFPTGKGEAEIFFHEPQKAVTPGQAVVFYRGDLVLGGGTITCTRDKT